MSRLALASLLLPALLVTTDRAIASEGATARGVEAHAAVAATAAADLPAWAAAMPSGDEISNDSRDAIQHDARAWAKLADRASRRALLAHLAHDASCGRAHAAALAGVLSAGVEPADVADAVSSASTGCNEVIVEAAGFAPNPDRTLAIALLRRTNDGDDQVRRAAWLSYGSIAETARTLGDAELAGSIDATLASSLASTIGEEHLLRVQAAGNAGCEACAGALAEDATSTDERLRRAAVAAHRFLPASSSVARMCDALEHDADATTRDLAAWALEWRTTHAADRASCLERAAVTDASPGVRLQAVRALGVLSDDANQAHDALGRLAERRGKVGELAARTLAVRETSKTETSEWSLDLR